MSDFISNVYKTPGFKHFKGDKSFKGFLELTYDYTNQEAELTEANEINEGAIDLLADDIEDAKTYDAFSDGNSVQARSTKKTWDDGVPVLKYIARAPKKSVKLPKEFKVVDDTKYGWWYLQISGVWYGIEQDDYGTPPFEY
jgi:lipoprotein-anchoring transpeptidase ErfK/SrfK